VDIDIVVLAKRMPEFLKTAIKPRKKNQEMKFCKGQKYFYNIIR